MATRRGGPPRGIGFAFHVTLAGAVLLAAFVAFPRADRAEGGSALPAGLFRPNVRVDDTGNLLNARAGGPEAFVAANGTIYVAWADGRAAPGTGNQDDLYFAKSLDGGLTYSRNVPVAVTANMSGGGSALDVAQDGTIFVVWGEVGRSSNPGIDHLYFSKSLDGGSTFSVPILIDGHAWDQGCVCSGIALARSGNILFVAWTQAVPISPIPGLFLARSTDRGAMWGRPVRIDDAGPDDIGSPGLAVDASGIVYAVWADITKGEARLVRSIDGGVTFGPSIAVSPPGWMVREAAIAARGP